MLGAHEDAGLTLRIDAPEHAVIDRLDTAFGLAFSTNDLAVRIAGHGWPSGS